MTLMERIKIRPFDELGQSEQLSFIETIRKKRTSALETARTTKGKGLTKSAAKNIAKGKGKGKKKVANPEAKAAKALEKLSPEQISKIAGML